MCDTIKGGKDKISIIIPVYNISAYLDSAIESVVHQTHKNVEIILVDDGSTDGSSLICDTWTTRDKRVKCIHQQNAGVSVARNTGFECSTGEYILFADGDDVLAPNMCQVLLESILINNSDASYCGFFNVFENKTETIAPQKKILQGSEIQHALVTELSFFTAIWNKLFRREVLQNSEGEFIGFPQGIYVGEDALWLARVLKNAKTVSAVPCPLYYWQRRANSATQGGTSVRTDARFLTQLDALKAMVQEFDDPMDRKITCKKYLGLCRDCMIQAYRETNEALSSLLKTRLSKDLNLYPRRDLFSVKLRICMLLVMAHAPIKVIEAIQNAGKQRS